MSIHLVCHLNCDKEVTGQILENISKEHADLFARKFLLGDAKASNDIDEEVAAEHEFVSRSNFYIRLNVKDESIRLKEVANLMRDTFGDDQILVLFENSTPF